MKDRDREGLPREWLPEPVARADGDRAAEWERRLQSLMRAAEPTLAELARRAESPGPASRPTLVGSPWWAVLGARWKPALAAATLAAAVLVLGLRFVPESATARSPSPRAFTLTAVTGGGEAAALWQGVGAQADPVLAHLVLQGESE